MSQQDEEAKLKPPISLTKDNADDVIEVSADGSFDIQSVPATAAQSLASSTSASAPATATLSTAPPAVLASESDAAASEEKEDPGNKDNAPAREQCRYACG